MIGVNRENLTTMNENLKSVILAYKVYLQDKKAKAQNEKFDLRSLNKHLEKPKEPIGFYRL